MPTPRGSAPAALASRPRAASAPGVRRRLRLLHPELIYVGEDQRVVGLERAPAIEIDHRRVVRKPRLVQLLHRRVCLEADEGQSALGEKRLDVLDLELMLLDVKQQIAAIADRVEVAEPRDGLQR